MSLYSFKVEFINIDNKYFICCNAHHSAAISRCRFLPYMEVGKLSYLVYCSSTYCIIYFIIYVKQVNLEWQAMLLFIASLIK